MKNEHEHLRRVKNVIGAHHDGQPDKAVGPELGHKLPADRRSIHHILSNRGHPSSSPIGNILGHEHPRAGNIHGILRKKHSNPSPHIPH